MNSTLYHETETPTCLSTTVIDGGAATTTTDKVTTKAIEAFVRSKLATDPAWATYWLVGIFQQQTATEQATASTCA